MNVNHFFYVRRVHLKGITPKPGPCTENHGKWMIWTLEIRADIFGHMTQFAIDRPARQCCREEVIVTARSGNFNICSAFGKFQLVEQQYKYRPQFRSIFCEDVRKKCERLILLFFLACVAVKPKVRLWKIAIYIFSGTKWKHRPRHYRWKHAQSPNHRSIHSVRTSVLDFLWCVHESSSLQMSTYVERHLSS